MWRIKFRRQRDQQTDLHHVTYRPHRPTARTMKRSGQYHDVLTMSDVASAVIRDLRTHVIWRRHR